MAAHSRHVNYQQRKWPQVVAQELDLAMRVAPVVVLLHVVLDEHEGKLIRQQWDHYLAAQDGATERRRRLGQIKIEVVISPFRTIVRPVANFIRWQGQTAFKDKHVAVLLPRQLHPIWWEWALQRRVARRVRRMLQGDPNLTIIDIPYTLGAAPVAPPNSAPTDNPADDAAQNNADTASDASGSAGASDASDASDTSDTSDPDTASDATPSPDAARTEASGEEALGE